MLLTEWLYAGRTFKGATYLFALVFMMVLVSFSTPYWLVSVPSEQLPSPKFTNLGLWVVCLNGYRDMRLQYERTFYGCKHVLLEDYDIIRDEIQPGFMIATQFFFTLCFCGLLLALLFLLMFLCCINDYYRVHVLRALGIDIIVAAAAGSVALIIFGVRGDGRYFMPDWEHNFHSWSFGVGCVGVILMYICGVLYIIEARIVERQDRAREKQYPMERPV